MECSATFDSMLDTEDTVRQKKDHKCLRDDESWTRNLVWREKVVQWCYDVADHLDEDRSVVYVAMNILDRFCASTASTRPMDEKMYEVASLSSIFLAVRIAGSGELLLQELISMSRGGITSKDIVTTGTSIINALSWEHRILTPIDFVKAMIQLIPSLDESPRKQAVLDSASYLIELAVCDVFLSHFKPSCLAVAAMLSALQTNLCSEIPVFLETVCQATSIEVDSDEITLLCTRLQSIYSRSVDSQRDCGPHLIEDEAEENVPRVFHNIGEEDLAHNAAAFKRACEVVSHEDDDVPLKRTKVEH